jgi:recombinational DNA repair protein RecT
MSKAPTKEGPPAEAQPTQNQQQNGNGKGRTAYKDMTRRDQVRVLLTSERFVNIVSRALPRGCGVTAEKLIWTAVTIAETPDRDGNLPLYECTDLSLMRAVMKAAELGLVFGGARADCWLIAYSREATFQMAAHGYKTLAYRGGRIRNIWADVIYEADEWKIVRGAAPNLIHDVTESADRPGGNVPIGYEEGQYVAVEDGGRGRPLFAYACAKDEHGEVIWDYVTEDDCRRARNVSRSPNSPAYKQWPDGMRERTAVTRAANNWPCADLISRALELEERDALSRETEDALKDLHAITTQGQTVATGGAQKGAMDEIMNKRGLPTPGPSAREQMGEQRETANVPTQGDQR